MINFAHSASFGLWTFIGGSELIWGVDGALNRLQEWIHTSEIVYKIVHRHYKIVRKRFNVVLFIGVMCWI